MDCAAAKRFFSRHNVPYDERSIENDRYRNELVKRHKRMAVPTIVIGDAVVLGFQANLHYIEQLLGVRLAAPAEQPDQT